MGARRQRGGPASRRPDKGGGRAALGALSALADRSAGRAPAAGDRAHKSPGLGGGVGGAKINCPIKLSARGGGGAAAPGDAGRRIMKCAKS